MNRNLSKSLILLFLLTCSVYSKAQKVNYLQYRDQVYDSACGPMDSIALQNAFINMDRVDTTKLSNLAFYYMDLAMIHWKMQWMDSTHLDKYLQYNRRAAQLESTIATPYYNLATAFIIKKDCSSALAAAEAYYDHPKKIKGLEAELKKALKDCPSHPRKD